MTWPASEARPVHDAGLEHQLPNRVNRLASRGQLGDCRLEGRASGTHRAIGKRISVVGASGSGKSHVSRILRELLDLPVCALDDLRDSLPGGALDTWEFARRAEILAARDAWIIDGHYVVIRHLIWQRADTIVLLNYPLYLVFIQILRRYVARKSGRLNLGPHDDQPDNPARAGAGWRQRWHRLLKIFRERQDYTRILRSPEYGRVNVIELKSRKATQDWLETVRSGQL